MKRYILGLLLAFFGFSAPVVAQTQQESGAVGVEGTIQSKPPATAPTITTPTSGQTFTTLPITVAGLCQNGLLVEIFKNGVFSGAAQCVNSSYSLQIDLFSGRNDLIARQYDALNQASPDSNKVTVTFNDSLQGGAPRISLTTAYSKRGAVPGETLSWPITISNGTPPYAISVDWGDKSAPTLLSRSSAGDLSLEHIYTQSGIYNIIIKATDKANQAAFLQVIGVGNGPTQQTANTNRPTVVNQTTNSRLLIVLLILSFIFIVSSFWLGKKHQLQVIRSRIRRGVRPF